MTLPEDSQTALSTAIRNVCVQSAVWLSCVAQSKMTSFCMDVLLTSGIKIDGDKGRSRKIKNLP